MKRLDPAQLFDAATPRDHLARDSARGGVLVIGTQGGQFLLQLISITVLARILTPEDYGLVAMVAVVINFAAMFKDAGLSLATVQQPVIHRDQISALFWVNCIISAAIGATVWFLAPAITMFYGKPELTGITTALAIAFLLSGISIQHQALLQRHMRFDALAAVQILAQAGSVALTIALAFAGWGYWALVAGTLTHAMLTSCGYFIFCPWRPGKPSLNSGIWHMLAFGGHLTGFNIINYFARNADNLLIGRYLGAEPLGIYGRAYQILMLPISMLSGPLGNVAIPTLSRLASDRERLRKYYLHLLYLLALLASPVAGVAFLASHEIVALFLGPGWKEVGNVFRYLAIGGLFQPLYNTMAWPLIATGRADRVFRWGLIGTPVIVLSFIAGLPYGVDGVAFFYSLAVIVVTISSLTYAGRSIELPFWHIADKVGRPLAAGTGAILAGHMFAAKVWVPAAAATRLFFLASFFSVVYVLLLIVLYNGLKPLRDLVAIAKFMRAKD